MIVYYMGWKHGHSCTGATHMTKDFVKTTILFLQCVYGTPSVLTHQCRSLVEGACMAVLPQTHAVSILLPVIPPCTAALLTAVLC